MLDPVQELKVIEIFSNCEDPLDKTSVMKEIAKLEISDAMVPWYYHEVGEKHNFLPKFKQVKKDTLAMFEGLTGFKDYEDVVCLVDDIVNEIPTATTSLTLRRLKMWCKKMGIEVPAKPKQPRKKRVATKKVSKAIADYVISEEKITPEGMCKALLPFVKNKSNAINYTNTHFIPCYCSKYGIPYIQACDTVRLLPDS